MQEVITLPLNVLENFPMLSETETNQSTFLKDLTISLAETNSQGMKIISHYIYIYNFGL